MTSFLNRHYIIQHGFYFFQIFKLEPKFLGIRFFFLYTLHKWNSLNNMIRSSKLCLTFRKRLLNLIRPKCNEIYGIHHPTGLSLLTRLRLGLSHLNNQF